MSQSELPPVAEQGGWQARWERIRNSPRAVLLGLLVVAVFFVFARRLWTLQFVKGDYYRQQAQRQSTTLVVVPAARGIVYDRNGTPLVRNAPSFDVIVVPAYLPDDEQEAENVLIRLAFLLDMPYTTAGSRPIGDEPPEPGLRDILRDTLRGLEGNPIPFYAYHRPVIIKRGVERDKALLVAQQTLLLPGVAVEVESARDYPYGPLLSQVLGYMLPIPGDRAAEYEARGYDPNTDRVGVAGIEATYEDYLRGKNGLQVVEKDVLGRVVRVVEERAAPVPGDNVYLTIDKDLQQFATEALQAGMEKPQVNSPRGVVIVMNPQTGEILAMVSLPTYDDNLFTHGLSALEWDKLANNPHRPLLNHAISDRLPPGSVFKVIVAAGALQEGVLTPYTHISCPGKIVVPNKYYPNDPGRAQPFYCWFRAGHGSLDVVGAIAHSCDVFFYETGGGFEETHFEGLGVSRIAHYAHLFGLGSPTGVELPAEVGGLVPTSDWKRLTYGESWSTGDTYNFAIGQGFLTVTPLQMLNAVNAIANGGTLYRPQIVHHVTTADGELVRPFEPIISRTLPISAEHLSLVQQGMKAVVDYGTASKVVEWEPEMQAAGKTGTAQFCDDIMCGVGKEQPEHAWFAAYAPADAPEISVIVFVYNGGEGSLVAAPIAHAILAHYFGLDQPPQEDEGAGGG